MALRTQSCAPGSRTSTRSQGGPRALRAIRAAGSEAPIIVFEVWPLNNVGVSTVEGRVSDAVSDFADPLGKTFFVPIYTDPLLPWVTGTWNGHANALWSLIYAGPQDSPGSVADPNSPSEWLALAAQHEVSARLLAENKIGAGQSVFHVGLAVEAALKAYIMYVERLNGWPSKEARPELYTHDLRALVKAAGIKLTPLDPRAASWHLVLQWDRGQGYEPQTPSRKFARSWVRAASGEEGVVTWIRSILTPAA